MPESTARPAQIWLVDDSPTEIALIERTLGSGFDYERFDDGSAVIERISASNARPDLLIVDWIMPGVPGIDVCKYVRSQRHFDDVPIVIVTASRITTSDVVTGLELGANDYVARPFAPEELRARVSALLRAKQLAQAAAREQRRLATVNLLGRSLYQADLSFEATLAELATSLVQMLCDGCSVLLLPGPVPEVSLSRHRNDASGSMLASISMLADPSVHSFASSEEARHRLPPAYHPYIDRFGLRGLAIFPFPLRDPVQGVVTVTRDGGSEPFHPTDIATIETCIEYAGLAAESALRLDDERVTRMQLDAVLRALPIGILAANPNHRLTLVNDAAQELLPSSREARDLASLFRVGTWTTVDGTPIDPGDLLYGSDERSRRSQTELCHVMPGNTPRSVAVSVVPLRDGQGLEAGTVTMLQDVSAERMVEAERERTAHFQQEVLGIVGHDLRNPLSAITTGLELLDMMVHNISNGPSVVNRLRSSTKRMERIIDQLLDVTRSRLGGGIQLALRPGSLSRLAASVIDEQRLAYPKLRFELSSPDSVEGVFDMDRLSQVLSNLLSNAAQYGRIDAPITLDLVTDGVFATMTVRNVVRDQPIPAEILDTLFDPFRRGSQGERNRRGLGLGLYIAHEIVRSHAGTLTAASDARYTTFTVRLPLQASVTAVAAVAP